MCIFMYTVEIVPNVRVVNNYAESCFKINILF